MQVLPSSAQGRPLLGLGAVALALLTLPASAQPTPSRAASVAMPSQAGFYRMKVGDFNVTALSDGTVPQKPHDVLTGAKPGQISRSLDYAGLGATVETSVNAYLIEAGARLILVDAGTGDLFGPTVGTLSRSLAGAGYRPEQISDVLLTHIHTDHSGGLMNGKALAFPNAIVHVAKREADYWLSPRNFAKASAFAKARSVEAQRKVGPVKKAGRLRTFEGDVRLFPGIRALGAYGHTPGHTFYVLESRGQKLMFWGDTMHAAAVQFPDPNVTITYDTDSKKATATRKKFLRDAAAKGYWVAFAHVPFPGIGHVRAHGTGYRWLPINYSDDGVGQ